MAKLLPNGLIRKSADLHPDKVKKMQLKAVDKGITVKEVIESILNREVDKWK